MDDCLSLLEMLFEAIPSSHFVQETLQKSEFVVKGEKPILQTQEVMTELQIVLHLRNKTFSYKVILELNQFHIHKQSLIMFLPNFVSENIVR